MSDYQEFRRKARKRKLKKRLLQGLCVLAAAAIIVGTGGFIASSIHAIRTAAEETAASTGAASAAFAASASQPGSQPDSAASSLAEPVQDAAGALFAPTPVSGDVNWNTAGYAVRSLDTTVLGQDDGTTAMDFRLAAQPACGNVDLSYYNNVTFMGDSLTQGLELYTTGLPNAHYCAYKGIGPNAVVNGATCTRLSGAKEIPMDALVASAPNAVYILFGTNVLTSNSGAESFLAYYGTMIDMVQTALPGITIYIQSITPVRPDVKNSKPGLNNPRLMAINDEVAAMALSKGCYFLDLWEVLADGEGNLIAEYAQPDGIHLKPEGYAAWVSYLRTHTAYTPGVMYEAGTSYYIEQ